MAISLGGIVPSRGPEQYGLFAAAFGLLLLPKCKPVGIEYLVRREGEEDS